MSRKIAKCSRTEQWFYFRLLPFADDFGRLPGDLFALKGLCFPHESLSESEGRKFLLKLHEVRLVNFAEGKVVEIIGFDQNQKIGHRPATSLYPGYQSLTGKGQERLEKVGKGTERLGKVEQSDDLSQPALSYINLDLKKEDTTYRNIQGLILTKDEYTKLISQYDKGVVEDVLESMENYKGLGKKYVSAYKTALNWIKRRDPVKTPFVDRPMRSVPE